MTPARQIAESLTEAGKPFLCSSCGQPAEHTYTGLCKSCLMDHYDDDGDEYDPEGPAFECAGYYRNDKTFYCPMWGSEECDWECPNGGLEP